MLNLYILVTSVEPSCRREDEDCIGEMNIDVEVKVEVIRYCLWTELQEQSYVMTWCHMP